MVKAIFDRLPSEDEVIDVVTQQVTETCAGHKSHLATLARDLLGLASVHALIRHWWGFLIKTKVGNADQPATSARAANFTKAWRDAHQEAMEDFIRQDDIRG